MHRAGFTVRSLSRGEYREMSGIKRTCAESAKILACLQSLFHSLAEPGSSLKAADCSEILEYMRRYNTFSRHWWSITLRWSESRRRLVGYMGKRRVLDGFFSRIKKIVSFMFPDKRIEVAYARRLRLAPRRGRPDDGPHRQGRGRRPDRRHVQGVPAHLQGRPARRANGGQGGG